MVAEIALPASAQQHLRRLDMRRDLAKVADLVELCFAESLDPEGKRYLAEMRKAAQSASLMGWASSLIEEAQMPPSGYVWEQDGRLVGNLSLIPISVHGKRGYMIANVATHPDFRGRGIAMALTIAALKYSREHGAANIWLQVREDNPIAIHIYIANGFVERLRRTSWYNGPIASEQSTPVDTRVINRHLTHWKFQQKWLKRLYPSELTWHIPFDWNLFRPDAWGKIYRTLMFDFPHHWSVERNNALQGVLSWKHAHGFTDSLWLALPEQFDAEAILALLLTARNAIRTEQPLCLNFPADLATNTLRQAGFYPHQTLIWMEYQFSF
jgi:ribosomal protein S18 acetylase RimI-like enzyme